MANFVSLNCFAEEGKERELMAKETYSFREYLQIGKEGEETNEGVLKFTEIEGIDKSIVGSKVKRRQEGS